MSQLIVALPKSGKTSAHRVGGYLESVFEMAGLKKQAGLDRRDDYTVTDEGNGLSFQAVEAPSLGCARYLFDGVADVAILGLNRLVEEACGQNEPSSLENIFFAPLGLKETDCSVVLAYPDNKAQDIAACNGGTVVTSHFNLTARYLNRLNIKPLRLVAFDGATETACRLYKADALVDITQTGSSLTANNLNRGESIMQSTAVMAWRQGASAAKRDALSALSGKLLPKVQSGRSLMAVMP